MTAPRFALGARSLSRLAGVHPDILAVTHRAILLTAVDFGIPATGGKRTRLTQAKLLATGKSKTMRSRHRTGHAVDVYAIDPATGRASWDSALLTRVHDAFCAAACELGVALTWGGHWRWRDLPHHELPRAVYGTRPKSQSKGAAAFLAQIEGQES